MAPASSLAQNGCVNPGLGPGFDQQASEPTSGPALPFPTPRSARPAARCARCAGLALAARRWGRATYLPHRTAKVQEPETFLCIETRGLQSPNPIRRSVFLKCPFNGKAGLVFFNARHDDSGARRSIFAEKRGKPTFHPSSANSKGAE